MASLADIKTIIIVMMENRSFDHMLGYLSLPPFNRADVNGQSEDKAWLERFRNKDGLNAFEPFHNTNPYSLPSDFDPPHQRANVANHLGGFEDGVYAMNGFASALPQTLSDDPQVRRLVMGYFGSDEVPVNHFLASNFTICDRWFCPLPAGTQPNRLMAMSGMSMIADNTVPLPSQELVYDWLTDRNIRWRVYHQGIPFFTLMLKWVPEILLNDRFRSFANFEQDMANTRPNQRPEVIFIEPTYGDALHLGRSTDDHAPAGVSDGQEFLMQVYNAVTASPSFWRNCLLIVSYDEHGGFFDHVSPPLVKTEAPLGAQYPRFESLGVRTPAYIVSPFVKKAACVHKLFDHTSVLKLLGEKFGRNGSYSPTVDARPVESLSAALDFTAPIVRAPAMPPVHDYLNRRTPPPQGATIPVLDTDLKRAFRRSFDEMRQKGAGPAHPKFGPLLAQVP